jgi:hypothetical protein
LQCPRTRQLVERIQLRKQQGTEPNSEQLHLVYSTT